MDQGLPPFGKGGIFPGQLQGIGQRLGLHIELKVLIEQNFLPANLFAVAVIPCQFLDKGQSAPGLLGGQQGMNQVFLPLRLYFRGMGLEQPFKNRD